MTTLQSDEPRLSVVIPAFNEALRLGATLEKVTSFLDLRRAPYEVLVVDDGSSDQTAQVGAGFVSKGVRVIRLPSNQGKGAATRQGVLESRGNRVLLSDADLSTPIEDLEKLEARLAEAPVVIGSRAVSGARITRRQPFYREIMGKTFNKLLRLFGVRGINDTQCGFKLLEGDLARELFAALVTSGFAFDVELLWLVRRAGHLIVEEGVTWENSDGSTVDPLTDPPRMLLEILRFRWLHR